MTEDNVLVVDKTRCSGYTGKAIDKPKVKDFAAFGEWLNGAPRPEDKPKPELVTKQADSKPDKTVTLSPEEWEKKNREWAAAYDFSAVPTLEQFNAVVVPLMKEKGRAFIIRAAGEAKNRGYKVDRASSLYLEEAK